MASNTEVAKAVIDIDGKVAGQKLRELAKEARKLKQEMESAKIKGDKASYDKLKEQLAGVTKETDKLKRSTFDLNKVLADLSRKEMNLSKTASQSFGSQMTGALNKLFLAATATIASFTGLIMGARKAITTFAEWDDKLADVMKTTQLTRNEVLWLNEGLKKIDTRSSQLELLDLARVAGKLGIEGKENVLGFVKAADQIKVALSEDLGGDVEESINQIGKLTDIFKLQQEMGYEEAMIKTGSAINALGAASTANEAYLVEFSKRVAGVAPSAKMTIAQILGLGATLDQLGQASEVSSTVFAQVIPDMFSNTAEYAKVAGMSVKDFSKLLNEDANEAFIRMLQGLNGNNAGMEHLVKMLDALGVDGKRSISVLGVLSSNVETLRNQQALANIEFERGTSLTNEFNTKNETMQAKLDKAQKKLYNYTVELGQRLAPALIFSNNSMSFLVKGMSGAIETIRILTFQTGSATEAFSKQVDKVYELKTEIEPLLSRYDDLATKANRSKEENDELNTIIKNVAESIPSAVTQFNEYGEAVSISTTRVREFINTEMDRLKVVNAEAIKENEKYLRLTEQQLRGSQSRIDEITSKGFFTVTETQTTGTSGFTTTRKATADEIRLETEKYQTLLSKRRGYEAEIKRLNGDALKDELKKREDERKLAEQKEKELADLKKKEEEAAKAAAAMAAAALEAAKTQYEKLTENIDKIKAKIQELTLSGNLSEAMKLAESLKQMEDLKRAVDYFVQSGGNVEAVVDKIRIEQSDKGIDSIKDGEPLDNEFAPNPQYIPINKKPIKQSGFAGMSKDEKGDYAIEQAETVANATLDIWMSRADARFDHEMSLLDAQMNKELSNSKLTEEQKDKIRAKYAAKERKLKQEQFKKQKGADIIQSLINTSLAVVKALPNIPLAIAAGIAGAAQTAVIAAQPVPQFYTGGPTGAGLGFSDDKAPVAGVVHANEYVIPEWMRRIPQVIGFERVMEGIRTGRGYADGGVASPVSQGSNTSIQRAASDELLTRVLMRLENRLNKGVYAKMVYQDFERFEEKNQNIERLSGF